MALLKILSVKGNALNIIALQEQYIKAADVRAEFNVHLQFGKLSII